MNNFTLLFLYDIVLTKNNNFLQEQLYVPTFIFSFLKHLKYLFSIYFHFSLRFTTLCNTYIQKVRKIHTYPLLRE